MQAASAGCAYLAFVFPLSWLQFAVNDAAEEDCLRPLATRRARADNALPRAAARPAAVLLAQAAALAADPSPAAALALKALLLQFVAGLYRGGLVARRAGADGADPLRRIAGYLQQHCAEPLTLERMGAEFHMSPKYFSAWFKSISPALSAITSPPCASSAPRPCCSRPTRASSGFPSRRVFRAAAILSAFSAAPPAAPPGNTAASTGGYGIKSSEFRV